MKKLISVFLCFAMVLGVLLIFPVKAYAYSGGSGTEDDPYLISTSNDILEIKSNILKDPSLWSRKVYYKLANDITVSSGVSPLYETRSIGGLSCYVESGYKFASFSNKSEEFFMQLREREGSLYSLTVNQSRHGWLDNSYSELKTLERLWEMEYASSSWVGDGYIRKELYRKAAFTGVFDGNGHTITVSDNYSQGYLFGCIENGGVVKNLTVKGKKAGIAYSVSKDSTVFGCVLDSDWMYETQAIIAGGQTDDDCWGYAYEIVSGAIAYNYGTVENCINYSDGISGFVGHNDGTVKNCLNFHENSI